MTGIRFHVASAVAGALTTYAVVGERLDRHQELTVGADVAALASAGSLLHASVRSDESLVTLVVDPRTGLVEPRGRTGVPTKLAALAVHAGRVLGASYVDGVVTSTPCTADGLPTGAATEVLPVGDKAHCVAGDGPDVWVSVLGDDVVRRIPHSTSGFARDGGVEIVLPAGFGPRHLVVDAGRDAVFVLGECSGEIARIDRTANAVVARWSAVPAEHGLGPGVVRQPGTSTPATCPDGRPLTWAADITLDAAAGLAYATERTASLLSVNDVVRGVCLGTVPVETQPRGIRLDPSGQWLLVTGETSETVSLYRAGAEPELVDRAPVAPGAIWATSTLVTG